jgi:hypothetical protein
MPETANFHGTLVFSGDTFAPDILARYLRWDLNNHSAATLFPLDYIDDMHSQCAR